MRVQFKNLRSCELYLARAFEFAEDRPNKMTLTNNMRNVVVWHQEACECCGQMMISPNWPIEFVPMFSTDFLIRELRRYIGLEIPLTLLETPNQLPEMCPEEDGTIHCGCRR